MDNVSQHRITVCTSCKSRATASKPGLDLIKRLRVAIAGAGDAVPENFEIAGAACMAACDRQCAVAYHGYGKATYLFGDIDPDRDLADLVTFAGQYAYLADGWCSSIDRPGKLRKSTLARVPWIGFGAGFEAPNTAEVTP